MGFTDRIGFYILDLINMSLANNQEQALFGNPLDFFLCEELSAIGFTGLHLDQVTFFGENQGIFEIG